MNLKEGNGRVPVYIGGAMPYVLVDFPERVKFDELFHPSVQVRLLDQYWTILKNRSSGQTLQESGAPFGITRERVRQIEARFLRAMTEYYGKQ